MRDLHGVPDCSHMRAIPYKVPICCSVADVYGRAELTEFSTACTQASAHADTGPP